MINNKFKSGLVIICSLFFVPIKTLESAMPKDPIAKWQLINDDFYIDTNDFKIESENINFWIKKGNYEKTRLIIDCQNLRYRETFEVSKGLLKRSAWNPVLKNNTQYTIAKQLCFLSKVEGFRPESKRKQPSWVKRIVFIHEKNKNYQKELDAKNSSDNIKDSKELLFIEE